MKNIIVSCLLALSTASAQAESRTVVGAELKLYTDAVIEAANRFSFECVSGVNPEKRSLRTVGPNSFNSLKGYTQAVVNEDAQPVITFSSNNGFEKFVASVTTNADFTEIESINSIHEENIETIGGNLLKPVKLKTWVTTSIVSCRRLPNN